ncbi:MAG TPA: hypothetical protein VGD78_19485 [Chthoniobacterales bacterium]
MKYTLKHSPQRWFKIRVGSLFTLALTALAMIVSARAGDDDDAFRFKMVRSPAVVNANVLPNARASVRIESVGPVEIMEVSVAGLPPKTDFDFFVIQVPNAPFGLSWYQGDIETNDRGVGCGRFVGRFSIETFIVAPGSALAPQVHHDQPFSDAGSNPATGPVHTYHLGLWFNSPADAVKAGLPGAVTPFNGDHHAGVQVLNTGTFRIDGGPLKSVHP